MTEDLTKKKCEACTKESPPITEAEIQQLKPQIPDWDIKKQDESLRLERQFEFPDFAKALAFTNKVGEQAEAQGHHPALLTEWGKVTVTWWTHAINGLHKNDFVMAAKTDQIAS
ncbi:4a-hydroxytetrahydrobiopterin dehydratase [Nodosilinea sp. P-1105]|uniref:4a-hydroxytetrahydrobiopterin dehydratase n=1 Tax=Nodosilinea sp. P-1105 TaxID=2546229 RepID=UPI00146D4C30|nr:4a-hydroxytetrahydrobiopterin dehydratase [Nodosilinea sp. P-1105]NMF86781.1 4a-hydroxytetrahydrobiopterin dehydratase [Nodosilinea sp. P-1105]